MADKIEEQPVVVVSSTAPATETAVPANADQAAVASAPAVPDPPSVGADTAAINAEAKPEVPAAPGPSLLEEFDASKKAKETAPVVEAEKPAEAKPAEPVVAKVEEPKPVVEGEKPAEPAIKEPVALDPIDYWASVKLPETLKVDDKLKGDFTSAMDAVRRDPTVGAQGLIDLHNNAMTEYAEHVRREQMRVWNDTRKDWRTQVMADPILGGSRHETEMGKIAYVRDRLMSDAKPDSDEFKSDAKAVEDFLRVTGVGDHPVFLHIMRRAGRYVGEPAPITSEIKPAPTNGKDPGASRRDRMYDNTNLNPQ